MGLFSSTRDNLRKAYPPFLAGQGDVILELVAVSSNESVKTKKTARSFNFKVIGKSRDATGKVSAKPVDGNYVQESEELILGKTYTLRYVPDEPKFAGHTEQMEAQMASILLSLCGQEPEGIQTLSDEMLAFLKLDKANYDLNTNVGKAKLLDDGEAALAPLFAEMTKGEGKGWAGRRLGVQMRSKVSKKNPSVYFTDFAFSPVPDASDYDALVEQLKSEGWTFADGSDE